MTKYLFCRCNGGDYFQGEYCPFDGWSSDESRELAAASVLVEDRGQPLSIDALRTLGVSESAIARATIIEFGSAESAFQGLCPDRYFVDGKGLPARNVGEALR